MLLHVSFSRALQVFILFVFIHFQNLLIKYTSIQSSYNIQYLYYTKLHRVIFVVPNQKIDF